MSLPLYFDYAATTPVAPEVAQAMAACLTMDGCFANPASRSHLYGWQAEARVEEARAQVAELVGLETRSVVWTSGATEANNLALKGFFAHFDFQGHLITSQTEHKAVLDVAAYLEQKGVEVTYLAPDASGIIRAAQVEAALRPETRMLSLMWANNETGVIPEMEAIGELCRRRGIHWHVDAAQVVGKLELQPQALGISYLSLSAHKFYGPKGVGALLICPAAKVRLQAQIHGGGHEQGLRSGTLATHQLVGMGTAAALVAPKLEFARLAQLREQLWQGLAPLGLSVNGTLAQSLPSHLNLCFAGLDGETLLLALNRLALSTGSACNSLTMKGSYVLRAMGLTEANAQSSLRLSLGRYTTEQDIEQAITHIQQVVLGLRASQLSNA